MKTLKTLTAILLSASALALAGLAGAGCKSTGTSSQTDYYNQGELVARHKEKTRTTGLFVNSATANPQGTISYTNSITLTNGFSFHVAETKDFKAGAANYKTDAAGIKATGGAIGEAAGTFVNPTPTPGN